MIQQQINQPNLTNNQAVEIPSSRRIYAFKDLPVDAQRNLLRLQETDGDFLRVRYVAASTSGVLLVFLLLGFVLFLADLLVFFDESPNLAFDLKWKIVFSSTALIFAVCFLYLLRGFLRARRAPVKKGIYLTTTQVIETFDGTIRYRELKDASEISINKYQGGWSTSLEIKFADSDLYKYNLYMNNYGSPPAKLLIEAEKWQGKAEVWKNEAISAAERGDTVYFDSRDIIPKSTTANTPVLNKYLSHLLVMRVMFVITMAIIAFVIFLFYAIKIISE